MKNFIKMFQQLDQKTLVIFCDEGIYRIAVDIYLKYPNEFKKLVPCFGGFHMAKSVQHCIEKYIRGSGLDDALMETQVFRKKSLCWNVERHSLYSIAESNIDISRFRKSFEMGPILGK